ncbi:hypothetical protein [Amycolatopsis sp. BJA-103]|nr:hypothetical protein [Amycolatopsis sp. BJA-103]
MSSTGVLDHDRQAAREPQHDPKALAAALVATQPPGQSCSSRGNE